MFCCSEVRYMDTVQINGSWTILGMKRDSSVWQWSYDTNTWIPYHA